MRRHVNGVRRIGRNFRVGSRRCQTLRGKFGRVRRVNQIVRRTRAVRLLLEDRLQNGHGRHAVGARIDILLGERHERKCVEFRRFHVLRRLLMQFRHRCGIGRGALLLRQCCVVLIKCGRGGDIAAFTLRGRIQLLCLPDIFQTFFQSSWLRKIPQLVIVRHGFAPIRHRALGILVRGATESFQRLGVLKGMQQRQPFFERGLRVGITTGRKVHASQLIGRRRIIGKGFSWRRSC